MFTRDLTGTVPNRTGPDRILFTRDLSGTGTERIQDWTCKKAGPVLFGSVWIRSGPVPERSRVNRRPF